MAGINYPNPRRSDVKDILHGVTVEDPYRWMEDADSEETKAFVDAENNISRPFLEKCPERAELKEELTKLWDYPKTSAPFKYGDFYYYRYNSGLQNQHVVYQKRELNGKAEVFLDPNTLSEDGTISLTQTAFSPNGKYCSYGLSQSGSDWSVLHIKDTATKEDLPEKLERFRYSSMSWTNDEKGFFYGQYSDWKGKTTGKEAMAAENQKLFYHRVNTSQEEDILCAEFPENPKFMIFPYVSDCGKYVYVSLNEAAKDNLLYVADISNGVTGKLNLKTIYGKKDCQIFGIANDGETFYFQTNKNRPNYGIIKLNINKPDEWTDVIPENPNHTLQWSTCVGNDKLVLAYMEDVVTKVYVYNLNGELLQTLPFGIGNVNPAPCLRERTEVFFHFSSFLTPSTIYRCEIDKAPNAVLEVHHKDDLPGVSTDDLEAKQVFYSSKDGTKIPMFIIRNKNSPLDSSSPCLLYVYGGFNIPMSPSFNVFRLMMIQRLGFTMAVANIRGGGEYGEKWHNGGRLKNKQNTFDDVHGAAEYLANNGYTKSSLLSLMGGSNGGLVTTATINQRPELFGAAVAQVPVTDMFRFNKFTIGHAWVSDFGNPDKKEEFEVLAKYSPLHNIPENIDNYPSLLVTTADHDDRVVPSHSLKFVAELQHRLGKTNKKPLMLVIDTKAGHGAGKPTSKVIDEIVDAMCFLKVSLVSEKANES